MNNAETHHFFWSGPFSQWQLCTLTLWNRRFNCAEQAMMFGKAMVFGDTMTANQILSAENPGRQKALGRQVRGFDDITWDAEKVSLVTEVNVAKFDQNKGLRRKLFQTAPKILVEASPMDTIWGIGLGEAQALRTPPDKWPGENILGLVLTDVRDLLVQRYPIEAKACGTQPLGDPPYASD